MIIKDTEETTVRIKKIVVLKCLYKYIKNELSDVKVLSLDLIDNELYIYIDSKKVILNTLLKDLQKMSNKYLKNEFGINIDRVNITVM